MFASRNPSYDRFKSLRGGVFTLEGIIGVGKTTLGRSLENYLKEIGIDAKFFPEYVNEKLLGQYISDMKRYAYSFQMIMLCKRIEIYREAERFAKTGGVAIIDRSMVGDMTFACMQKDNGNFTDDEWETYISMMTQEIQLTPSASVFLRCTAETSMRRVKQRGILSEINGYTVEYMKQLQEAYDKTIDDCTSVRHIIIDWNDPIPMYNNGNLNTKFVEDVLGKLL